MAGLSDYLENKVLDKILRNVDFIVTTVWVSLHTADPGDTGASEVVGGSYVRKQLTVGVAVGGVAASTVQLEFSSMPACTVLFGGLWDASTLGNFLGSGTATNRTLIAGDAYRLPVGNITATAT